MEPYQLILSLRAVRYFTPQAIPDDVLERILQAARWTGSAKNTQPWQFVILRKRETLRELAALGRYASHLAGAALGIVLTTPRGVCLLRRRADCPEHDAGRLERRGWVMHRLLAGRNQSPHPAGHPAEFQAHTAISFGYPQPHASAHH